MKTRALTPNGVVAERANSGAGGGLYLRDVVWLLLTDAVETVDHVLLKALKDQKRKVRAKAMPI